VRKESRNPSKLLPTYAHPGQVLLEDFITPLGLSRSALARITGVPSRHICDIIRGRRSVDTETAIRFALALGTSARYWLSMQADYDVAKAQRALGASYGRIDLIEVGHQHRR
jgi:addiction module HigA family antidote